MRSISLSTFRFQPSLRRYGSVALALVIAAGLIAVPLSMLESYRQRGEELADLQAEIERLQARSAALGSGETALSEVHDLALILAPDVDVAAAHIQAVLRGLASNLANEEIRIGSVRVLPPLSDGPTTAVRATASLTVPSLSVFDVVNTIEASTPPIVIDSLRVLSRAEGSEVAGRDQSLSKALRSELTIVMRVYAQSALNGATPAKSRGMTVPHNQRRP